MSRTHFFSILILFILAAILVVPVVAVLHPVSHTYVRSDLELEATTSTNNTTSEPWWDQAWNDVTGAFGSFSYDASHWLSSGLSGAYNSISGSISGFFGNIGLSALEDSFNGVVASLLSFVGIATSEVSSLVSGLIQFFVGVALSPALGPFGPILALVILVALAVFTIILVRLLVDLV